MFRESSWRDFCARARARRFRDLAVAGETLCSVEYCRLFAMAELCCCCRRETETVVTVEDTVVVLSG